MPGPQSRDTREVVTDPKGRYYGMDIEEKTLIPGEGARLSETLFRNLAPITLPRSKASRGGKEHRRSAA